MSGQRRRQLPVGLHRSRCVICGQPGSKENPVTIRLTDSKPKHVDCRSREKEGNDG